MPTMVAAISVLDSKSPRRLERPPVASTAGMRGLGTGSFGSAGTVGATLRGTDEGRGGRTTAPGSMRGEATPAALTTTPVATPPPAAERATEVKAAGTVVVQAGVVDETPAERLIVRIGADADVRPVKERRNRPLILATAGAGITLAGAMLVGGWVAGPGTTEPVSLSGGHAAPQEPPVTDNGDPSDAVPPEGQFTGILPVAATVQSAPPTTEQNVPAASSTARTTTQHAAPKGPQDAPKPRFTVPQYRINPDWSKYERDYGHHGDRGGRRHR